jgi:tRNA(adenine34) deaminase
VSADDETAMVAALAVAEVGLGRGELPIGAAVVLDGEVVARAHTEERTQGRLLVHAELLALDDADRRLGRRRRDAVLATTVEPCLMCLGAAATAMVGRVVYALRAPGDGAADLAGAWDRSRTAGDIPHLVLPTVVGGVGEAAARALVARYVAEREGSADPLAAWARTLL